MPIPNINEILSRCKNNDTAAFRVVMEEYQRYAFAVAFRVVCNEEDAKDIVQESFIRAWKNLDRYNPAIKFTTWLYTIISNLCLDKLRANKRRQAQSLEGINISLLSSATVGDDPEQLYNNKELASIIGTLTEDLPPKQKMIFVLRDLQELSIQEVCEILHLSESSVKTNLVYARKYLRKKLELYLSK